jgi:transposase InsO family protein
MIAYIDHHKDRYGVEPICRVLPIAPSTYYAVTRRSASARAVRDAKLKVELRRVYDDNLKVYGARKIWRQRHREAIAVARCTVERLMGELGLQGVRRGKPHKTTTPDQAAPRPADLVDRDFSAARPNQLWVADLTYVATWSGVPSHWTWPAGTWLTCGGSDWLRRRPAGCLTEVGPRWLFSSRCLIQSGPPWPFSRWSSHPSGLCP